MIDGFKQSLSQINSIMWVALSLSLSVLILDPGTENIAILGISVNRSRLIIVVPVVLNGLLLVRQVYIRNVIEIIRRAEDRKELKEIVLAYPLIEFMRWKSKFRVETILLTIFQVILEISPAISIFIFWRILNNRS